MDEECNVDCKSCAECGVDGDNITVAVVTDDYPDESEYAIEGMDTNTILIHDGLLYYNNANYTSTMCFKTDRYEFTIYGFEEDGIYKVNKNSILCAQKHDGLNNRIFLSAGEYSRSFCS